MKIQFAGQIGRNHFVAEMRNFGAKSCRLRIKMQNGDVDDCVYISTKLLNSIINCDDDRIEFRTFVFRPNECVEQTWLEAKVWSRF